MNSATASPALASAPVPADFRFTDEDLAILQAALPAKAKAQQGDVLLFGQNFGNQLLDTAAVIAPSDDVHRRLKTRQSIRHGGRETAQFEEDKIIFGARWLLAPASPDVP